MSDLYQTAKSINWHTEQIKPTGLSPFGNCDLMFAKFLDSLSEHDQNLLYLGEYLPKVYGYITDCVILGEELTDSEKLTIKRVVEKMEILGISSDLIFTEMSERTKECAKLLVEQIIRYD